MLRSCAATYSGSLREDVVAADRVGAAVATAREPYENRDDERTWMRERRAT